MMKPPFALRNVSSVPVIRPVADHCREVRKCSRSSAGRRRMARVGGSLTHKRLPTRCGCYRPHIGIAGPVGVPMSAAPFPTAAASSDGLGGLE